ncbi:MAG: glycosyltransferase family 2 protein [Planctomycetes bacterium]|nr:glycosyltransferase family 2 protein [Planctomycetota bacterium]
MRDRPRLVSVVVPACNEQDNVSPLIDALAEALAGLEYEIIFVDDGSDDATFERIDQASRRDRRVVGISFSRNFGHQYALAAGLRYARGDVVITMDADLQHPPSLLPEMIDRWRRGYNVVLTRRLDAAETPPLKRLTSRLFYRVFSVLCGVRLEEGMADFRLLDRAIVDELNRMNEGELFLRGLIAWMGYRRAVLEFRPGRRHAGQTKYTWRRMLKFAKSGLLSFSPVPLRMAILLGCITAALSFLELLYAFVMYAAGRTVSGWASTIAVMSLMFGVLFLLLGIQGEYILRIYQRVQSRPGFLVERVVRRDEPAGPDTHRPAGLAEPDGGGRGGRAGEEPPANSTGEGPRGYERGA